MVGKIFRHIFSLKFEQSWNIHRMRSLWNKFLSDGFEGNNNPLTNCQPEHTTEVQKFCKFICIFEF